MNKNQIGIALLVVGIILLVLGFNEYGTFGSRLGRALGAGMSNKVLALFIIGGVCAALGLMQTMKK
ncbi:MAG TPA: DUF3185 family protein [Nitrospirota bacterium]|nr:DUF3185 family protein [Nitrospirota bacterium]